MKSFKSAVVIYFCTRPLCNKRKIMKWTREVSKKVTKLYLTNKTMTDGLKQAINEWLTQEKEWLIGCQGSSNKSTCKESISDLLSFVDNLLSKK